MSGPLDGVRILEFTQIIAGPLGCMLLADQGAEVLKVEPIEGEPWRLQQQFIPLESKTFQSLNRGKKSLALNLQRPDAQEIIHRLVPSIDVVVSNYRPDVPARLNIDYDTLSKIRPDLIYCDSTAFGRKGPWANKGGYDIVVQGASGFTASGGRFDEKGNPILPGATATADFATGYSIAWGVCAALFYRERTGKGQLVETSLLANALQFQGGSVMSLPPADTLLRQPLLEYLADARGRQATYTEMVEHRRTMMQGRQVGNIYYRNYLTKDGAIAIGNLSASLRQKMRDALEIEYDPRDHDPEYDARRPDIIEFGNALTEKVEAMMREQPSAHWVELMERHGVPIAEIFFPEEMDQQQQVIENGYIVELDHDLTGPQTMAAPPHKMSVSQPTPEAAAPPLGRDTDEILRSAGYTDDNIAALRGSGVIR
jgi:formyl-CoA transferase